ncbi:MAG: AraC family transcriptional regulator [Acidobacteriota bacterium]|nr:AraC family transcriptional regulator [Acidobacteriota bacterium]
MHEPTFAAGAARALMEFAVSKGACRRALAERSRLCAAELDERDGRIPFAKYAALMRAGKELCDDPALALHFGESFHAETGVSCVIGGFAETGAEGFALWNRYSRLEADVECTGGGHRFVLDQSAGQLWLVDARANPNAFPELTELTFACMVCAERRMLGENRYTKAARFTYPEPAYRTEYERVFRMPVYFGSDRNALLLTGDGWMNEPPPSASRLVLRILRAHADALLESLESSMSTRGHVESILTSILYTGEANMQAVAGRLGVSRQTLFRRLRAEGTTFERVLDELRHGLALRYLNRENASVQEVAYLLGYSDRAAFSHAFKRWTGSSPRGVGPSLG